MAENSGDPPYLDTQVLTDSTKPKSAVVKLIEDHSPNFSACMQQGLHQHIDELDTALRGELTDIYIQMNSISEDPLSPENIISSWSAAEKSFSNIDLTDPLINKQYPFYIRQGLYQFCTALIISQITCDLSDRERKEIYESFFDSSFMTKHLSNDLKRKRDDTLSHAQNSLNIMERTLAQDRTLIDQERFPIQVDALAEIRENYANAMMRVKNFGAYSE